MFFCLLAVRHKSHPAGQKGLNGNLSTNVKYALWMVMIKPFLVPGFCSDHVTLYSNDVGGEAGERESVQGPGNDTIRYYTQSA